MNHPNNNNNTSRQKVLIAGANGTTGRKIVDILNKSDDYQPIAMVRKESQIDYFKEKQVGTVLADLEKELGSAVTAADKVIFAAGSQGKNVIGVDQEGAKRFTDAAKKAGVNKFVMLSSMGADTPAEGGELEEYLRAKQNADNHLKLSGLNYSIVRPGALTDKSPTGKIKLSEHLNSQGEISRADVAETLVEVLQDSVQQNQVFEIIAGDEVIKQAVR